MNIIYENYQMIHKKMYFRRLQIRKKKNHILAFDFVLLLLD